jgi:hypothetical protein
MSEAENKGLSIGSVTTGGDFVAGDQHKGDIVHGNKDESQGKVQVAGDVDGDITTYNTRADTSDLTKFFKSMLEEAENVSWDKSTPKEISQEFETPKLMLEMGATQAEEDILGINPDFEPEEFDEEQCTWFNRFKAMSPKILQGSLTVGEAVISTYVNQSPVVAGALAAIKFVKGEV